MRRWRLSALGPILSLLTISAFAADTPFDASKIITLSEAEKVLGEPVRDPQPLNSNNPDGYYSKCNYYSSKSARSLLVRVRQANAGSMTPQAELNQVAASGGAMKPVEGLGEKAGMFNGAPQNGLPDERDYALRGEGERVHHRRSRRDER